ncbi:MAG: PKD domain-containing protein [Gelidibacter sp.]
MKKSFWKLRLFFAGIAAIGLLATGCSSDDDSNDDVRKPLPIAKFSETIADLKVTFKNESTNAKTYVWDFGDQKISTEKDPVHEYSEGGTYAVKLTVTGDSGENSTTKSITVSAPSGGDGGNGGVGASIVVDGDFSDWENVPEDILFTAVLNEESTEYKRLKEVKVTSDDMYIYLYLKLDSAHANAMDIYINNDLSPETGYNGWMWEQSAANYLMQGFYESNYDMRLAGYDESKDGAWGWLTPNIVEAGSGLMTISEMKKVSGTIVEFEAKIIRDFIPNLGSEIRMSFGHSGLEGDAWSTTGGLPTVTSEGDKNKGLLVKLK